MKHDAELRRISREPGQWFRLALTWPESQALEDLEVCSVSIVPGVGSLGLGDEDWNHPEDLVGVHWLRTVHLVPNANGGWTMRKGPSSKVALLYRDLECVESWASRRLAVRLGFARKA